MPPYTSQLLPASPSPAGSLLSLSALHAYSFHMQESSRLSLLALEQLPKSPAAPGELCELLLALLLRVQSQSPNYNWDYRGSFHAVAEGNPADVYPSSEAVKEALAKVPPVEASLETPLSSLLRGLIKAAELLHLPTPNEDKHADYLLSAAAFTELLPNDPSNPDLCFIVISSLLLLHPWKLFAYPSGESLHPALTSQIVSLFETCTPTPHLGLNHLLVHFWELASSPSSALAACRVLDSSSGNLPHLLHMPSHITLQLGDYAHVVASNLRAVAADKLHLERLPESTPGDGFYTGYIAHDYHMAMYGACLGGYKQVALDVSLEQSTFLLPVQLFLDSPALRVGQETHLGLRLSVFMRFGMWAEILAATEGEVDAELKVYACARLLARAVALANTGRCEEGRGALAAAGPLLEEVKTMVRFMHNNSAHAVLSVELRRSEAELFFFDGRAAEAFAKFEEAVEADDGLAYDEPWGVLIPTRHSYAALLCDAGGAENLATAMRLYREDLRVHPKNAWSIAGSLHVLELEPGLGEEGEEEELRGAMEELGKSEYADVKIKSSCACSRAS